MNNTDQINLLTTAFLLAKGKMIDSFSIVLTTIFLITSLLLVYIDSNKLLSVISLAIFFIGVIEKYYAIRTQLDAELFNLLAKHPAHSAENLRHLDNTLSSLGLLKKARSATTLISRQHGAIWLLKKQVCCCLIQVILALSLIILVSC